MNFGEALGRALDDLEVDEALRPELEAAHAELEAGRAEACVDRLTSLGDEAGPAALYLMGLAHGRLGDLYRATGAFEAAVEAEPRLHRAYLALALIYEQQRDPTRTAAVLRRALQLRPDDPHAIAALARSYNTAGRPRRAETLARRGLELCPSAPVLKKALADALRRQDRHREAADLLEAVIAEDADAASLVGLGRCLLAINRSGDARPLFEQVLRHDSESVGALAGMAEALEIKGRLGEARGYILRALAAAPDLPRMYVLSARIHLADGRAEAAERAALMALRMAPQSDEASQIAIRAARARLRWTEAADYAEPLLARHPDDADALAAVYAHELLEDGDPHSVLQQLEGRLGQARDEPELHFVAGVAQLLLGQIEASVASLTQVVRLREAHPLAASLLGLAYQDASRRTDEARALAVRAVLRNGVPGGPPKTTSNPLPTLGVEADVTAILGDEASSPVPTRPAVFNRPSTRAPAPVPPPEPTRMEALSGEGAGQLSRLGHLRSLLGAPSGSQHNVHTSDLIARVDHLIEAHDQPISVALLGPRCAGRTTLLNALAGRIAIPETSRLPHVLRYGRKPLGRIVRRDGTIEALALPALRAALEPPPPPETIRRVEVLAPLQELSQINLLDRPDAGTRAPDAAIWIVSVEQPLAEWDAAATWLDQNPVPALAVISRIDTASAKITKRRLAAVRARLGARVAGVIPFSARAGLVGLAKKDLDRLRSSGFPALSRLLRTAIVDPADAIRGASLARRAEHVRLEALDRTERALETMAGKAAAMGALAGRLAVDRARLRHDAEHQLPDQLGRALRDALTARAAELTELRAGEVTQRARKIEVFRERLSRACVLAVQSVRATLDDQLSALLTGYFEVLDRVFPADDDPSGAARLNGLRAVLDGYRALLLEETFGRHAAFLEGWIAQAPLLRWVGATEISDPVLGLFRRGLNFDRLPPLPLDGLGIPLFDGLAAFVDTTAADLRVARVELSQQLADPLQRYAEGP